MLGSNPEVKIPITELLSSEKDICKQTLFTYYEVPQMNRYFLTAEQAQVLKRRKYVKNLKKEC
jgi:hypothetical protein